MVCDLELGSQVKKEITVLNFSLSDWGKNLHTGRTEKSGRKLTYLWDEDELILDCVLLLI